MFLIKIIILTQQSQRFDDQKALSAIDFDDQSIRKHSFIKQDNQNHDRLTIHRISYVGHLNDPELTEVGKIRSTETLNNQRSW